MKILLVRPSANKNIATISNLFFGEPLGIECVSTIFKEQGHEVKVLDFMAESQRNYKKYVLEFEPDIIGFTSQCSDVVNILATAKETNKGQIMTKGHTSSVFLSRYSVTRSSSVFFASGWLSIHSRIAFLVWVSFILSPVCVSAADTVYGILDPLLCYLEIPLV